MRTHAIAKSFLFLFLFSFSLFSIYGQQNVEQYNTNGLSINILNTNSGKITIYLPTHSAGENLAGTIKAEPIGKSDKQKAKNLSKIRNYQLVFGESTVPVSSGTFSIRNSNLANTSIRLLNENGKEIIKSYTIKMRERRGKIATTSIPSYFVSGEPTRIVSNCDGNLSNNSVRINNTEANILAESESELFFETPSGVTGSSELQFTNGEEQVETNVHVLGLQLSAGKLSLFRGEGTSLNIGVSGLQGLEENIPLQITNATPRNISLEGGNYQEVMINPSDDASNGTYQTSRAIQAIQNGGFSISVNVVAPELAMVTEETNQLCNCYLNGESYLISPVACEELGGNCSEQTTDEDLDDTEDESPPDFNFTFPQEITDQDDQIHLQILDRNEDDCLAVIFTLRSIDDDQWQFIGEDSTSEDGLTLNWNPPLSNDGVNEIRAQVVNANNVISQQSKFIYLNVTPIALNDPNLNTSFSISMGDIKRALDKARATGDRIDEEWEKLQELIRKYWEAFDNKKKNKDAQNELIAIDEVLDSIPKTYKDELKAIIDSLSSLKNQLPEKIDKAAMKKAVAEAQKRVDDCNKRLEELKKEQADLEAERDRLKEELDATLKEMDDMYTRNGWKGGYGYHADGRPWYGYIGNDRANIDLGDEKYELRKKYKALKKSYLKTLGRLAQLPNEIADAEKECDELNNELESAKQAAEKGDQYMAVELEADDICRQIRSLLRPLLRWCNKNSDECSFKAKLQKLMKECAKDSADLADFWKDLANVIKAKKEQEKAYGDAADADQKVMDDIDKAIENANDRIKALKEQQGREYAEAERKRKQRAQEIENERQRKRETAARKKAAEKKKEAKPEPYLKEPVDPSDDQLKAMANSFVFKKLYWYYLINKGPCDCTTKAIAFANDSNSIWSDLVGRIGVGVAFAPLEAFPGVSLAGRLGIGAVKALASKLFGGQKFSEELTKNLFNVIGGEIFPKLVGNKFTGDRLNDLSGKGLEEIFEAEGVRAISWEGKVKMKNCGEVTGTTTMLINPNTGWVTILIKIEDCPLIVIKYKVNDDGVPTTKPIVKTVKG